MQRLTQDVEEKLDRVMAAQGVTNRGVRLLCSVFDEATGQHHQRQKQGRDMPALRDNGRCLSAADEAVDRVSFEMLPPSSSSAATAAAGAKTAAAVATAGSSSSSTVTETASPGDGGVSSSLRSEIGRYLREDLSGGGGGGGGGDGKGDDFDLDSLEANIQDITNMYGR